MPVVLTQFGSISLLTQSRSF